MQFILTFIITCLALFLGAIGGFGSGILGMSLFVLFLPLRTAVVAFALASFIGCAQLAWTIRNEFPFKPVLSIISGRFIGLWAGIHLLTLDLETEAKYLLSGIILLISIKELFFYKKKNRILPNEIKVNAAGGFILGIISGVLNGWINMGGPPLILYAFRSFEGKTARRFLIAIFTLTYPIQISMNFFKGLVTREVSLLALVMIPGVLLGTFAGNKLQKRLQGKNFLLIIWIILLVLGVILGVTTLLKVGK